MKYYEEEQCLPYSKGKPFSVWIGNLGKYNEGELAGKWVSFPTDQETIDRTLKEIGIGSTDVFGQPYEETFIADYDWYLPFSNPLGEYESFDELNYLAARIDEMSESEYDTFCAACEEESYSGSAKDLINLSYNLDSFIVYPEIDNDYDLGQYYVEECNPDSLNKMGELADYIDYERYGRNCRLDEGGTFTEKGYVIDQGGHHDFYDGRIENIPAEYRLDKASEKELSVKDRLLAEAREKCLNQEPVKSKQHPEPVL